MKKIAVACLITLLHVPLASAGIQPEPFRTGLFGVTVGQSIRISVLNAGAAGGVIDPCFHVLDATGALLFEIAGGPLGNGAGTFVDVMPMLGGTVGGRAQVRAAVVFEHPVKFPPDPVAARLRQRSVIVTLEVFDTATGQTRFTTPFASVAGIEPQPFVPVAGIDPQPFVPVAGVDPTPFKTGLFGIKEGQAIRISVLNAGEAGGIIEPCARFFGLDGTLLFEADGGPLSAGTGGFVDFDPLPPGPARIPGLRAQLRVEVEIVPAVYPPDPISPPRARRGDVHLTLEVFDAATGQTVYTMPFVAGGFSRQAEPPEPVR